MMYETFEVVNYLLNSKHRFFQTQTNYPIRKYSQIQLRLDEKRLKNLFIFEVEIHMSSNHHYLTVQHIYFYNHSKFPKIWCESKTFLM